MSSALTIEFLLARENNPFLRLARCSVVTILRSGSRAACLRSTISPGFSSASFQPRFRRAHSDFSVGRAMRMSYWHRRRRLALSCEGKGCCVDGSCAREERPMRWNRSCPPVRAKDGYPKASSITKSRREIRSAVRPSRFARASASGSFTRSMTYKNLPRCPARLQAQLQARAILMASWLCRCPYRRLNRGYAIDPKNRRWPGHGSGSR